MVYRVEATVPFLFCKIESEAVSFRVLRLSTVLDTRSAESYFADWPSIVTTFCRSVLQG